MWLFLCMLAPFPFWLERNSCPYFISIWFPKIETMAIAQAPSSRARIPSMRLALDPFVWMFSVLAHFRGKDELISSNVNSTSGQAYEYLSQSS